MAMRVVITTRYNYTLLFVNLSLAECPWGELSVHVWYHDAGIGVQSPLTDAD